MLVEAAVSDSSPEADAALRDFRRQSDDHKSSVQWAAQYLRMLPSVADVAFSDRDKAQISRQAFLARWRVNAAVFASTVAAALLAVCILLPERDVPSQVTVGPAFPTIAYRTYQQDQRTLMLSDGSTIWLDWSSSVSVTLTDRHRTVVLKNGRAAFSVTSDPLRPFFVIAEGVTTKVTGTEFTVSRQVNAQIEVAVLHGQVEVSTPNADRATPLSALQVLTSPEDGGDYVSERSVEELAAWRNGQIVVRDRPIHDVLKQLSPYLPLELDISALEHSDKRISGTFYIDRSHETLEGLIFAHNLQREETAQGRLKLRPPPLLRP